MLNRSDATSRVAPTAATIPRPIPANPTKPSSPMSRDLRHRLNSDHTLTNPHFNSLEWSPERRATWRTPL